MNKIYLVAFITLVHREILRFLRTWSQSLLPPVITMTLYFTIFGNFIGSKIPLVQGFKYIQYIAPGLIMMAVITNSYANVAFSLFINRFQKSIEEILIAPIPNSLILLGFTISGVLRGLIVGIFVTVLALCFTHLKIHNLLVIISVVLLSSFLFSLAGFANGLFAKNFDDAAFIPTFVLTPLTYLGGVFYSINLLPNFWRTASLFNPVLYIVNAFRYGILGITDIPILITFGILLTCCLALFILNLHLLKKGVGTKT